MRVEDFQIELLAGRGLHEDQIEKVDKQILERVSRQEFLAVGKEYLFEHSGDHLHLEYLLVSGEGEIGGKIPQETHVYPKLMHSFFNGGTVDQEEHGLVEELGEGFDLILLYTFTGFCKLEFPDLIFFDGDLAEDCV